MCNIVCGRVKSVSAISYENDVSAVERLYGSKVFLDIDDEVILDAIDFWLSVVGNVSEGIDLQDTVSMIG